MRGSDIDFNPVFYAYVLVTAAEIHFAVDDTKLPADFQRHLKANCIDIKLSPYDETEALLKKLVVQLPTIIFITK